MKGYFEDKSRNLEAIQICLFSFMLSDKKATVNFMKDILIQILIL